MGFFSKLLPAIGTVAGGLIGSAVPVVGTAIGASIGGALGGALGGGGGNSAAGAAARAGDIQAGAANAGIAEQRRQFDINQQNLQPFQQAGVSALGQQQALLGLGGDSQAAFDTLSNTPGQRFLRDQQERALLRNASAIGGLGGGNVRKALQDRAFQQAQTDFGNQFNRLSTLTGGGQNAVNNIGQFGANTASNVGNLLQNSAQARASGILGAQQQRSQQTNQLTGALSGLPFDKIASGIGSFF